MERVLSLLSIAGGILLGTVAGHFLGLYIARRLRRRAQRKRMQAAVHMLSDMFAREQFARDTPAHPTCPCSDCVAKRKAEAQSGRN